MLDITLLFKLGGVGILLLILEKVLKGSGKEDVATMVNIVGIVIILAVVLGEVGSLFNTLKATFML